MDTKKLSFGAIREVANRMGIPFQKARRWIIYDDTETLLVLAEVELEWRQKKQDALQKVESALAIGTRLSKIDVLQ